MSKAEELAKEYTEKFILTVDHQSDVKEAYIDGYHQAEKDNELTWEDVREICVQSVSVLVDSGGIVSDERHYTEVLKRFNKERKEK